LRPQRERGNKPTNAAGEKQTEIAGRHKPRTLTSTKPLSGYKRTERKKRTTVEKNCGAKSERSEERSDLMKNSCHLSAPGRLGVATG